MKLVDFIEALEEAALKYMGPLRILVRTDNAVKARVEISENIFVQFYFHQMRLSEKPTFRGIFIYEINAADCNIAFYFQSLFKMSRFYHFSDNLRISF